MNIDKIKETKEKFERGEITQDDMDIEMQYAVADLYKSEIEDIRENISNVRNEKVIYSKMIDEIDKTQEILDDFLS